MFVKKMIGFVTKNELSIYSDKTLKLKNLLGSSFPKDFAETISLFFDNLTSEYVFNTKADYLSSYYKTIFEIQKEKNRLYTPSEPDKRIMETIDAELTSERKSVYRDIESYIIKNPNLSEQEITNKLDTLLNESKYYLINQLAQYHSRAVLDAIKNESFEELVFHSSNADKICARCTAMDGQVFNFKDAERGINCPPLHPNCQCSIFPNLEFHLDLNFFVDYEDWVIKYLAGNQDISFYLNQLLKGVYSKGLENMKWNNEYSLERT